MSLPGAGGVASGELRDPNSSASVSPCGPEAPPWGAWAGAGFFSGSGAAFGGAPKSSSSEGRSCARAPAASEAASTAARNLAFIASPSLRSRRPLALSLSKGER